MLLNCFAVGVGGFIGAVLRYLVGLIPALTKGPIPLQTLTVNVLGAVAIGIIAGFTENIVSAERISPQTVLFLKTGVCGGFTTFSTFSLETAGLLSSERPVAALFYTIISVALCVVSIFAGRWIADMIK